MYLVKDWRKRKMVFEPPHYTLGSYYTDVNHKREMRHSFGDDLLNNLHLLPDPLKKNLADSIITCEEPKQKPSKKFLNVESVENLFPIAKERASQPETPTMAPFSGITNFISGVFNVITGAMSQLRPRSPVKYYDCFDESNASHQASQPSWHPASSEDQNKNERAHNLISNAETDLNSDMNKDCRSAVAQCEDKLNKVRLLLTTKPVETPKFRPRRPRKVFVEPGSVEENFEDAFAPEDFVSLSNNQYIEYYSPFQYQCEELLQTDSPRMRTEVAPVHETTAIVKTLPVVENNDKNCTSVKSDSLNSKSVQNEIKPVKRETGGEIVNNSNVRVEERLQPIVKVDKVIENNAIIVPSKTDPIVGNSKEELVSSCEDKLSKLKALLQERRKNNKTITSSDSATESLHETNDKVQKPAKTAPINKPQDKHFKNPHRRTDKRRKIKLKKHINDDMMFAHEIHSEELSSAENSPSTKSLENRLAGRLQNRIKCINKRSTFENHATTVPVNTPQNTGDTDYFDEVSGKFHSMSATDSDDSFQVVFTDSPKPRSRLASECDSEDSFIVFEDNPDCYTTNDVFGDDSEDDDDYTDSDSELSDSGCISKLAHNLSRTIGDLTDDSLYDDSKCVDEVDCAVRTVCEEIPCEDIVDCEVNTETKDSGLILTEAKKMLRKNQPSKKVQFSSQPPEVHVMRVWAFAARQARVGHWERYALDRDRFKRRIADVDMAVSWVLKPQHRSRVMFQRFMPWWNQLKRKELAEKKQKKEEEDRRLAEEKEREELMSAEEKEREEQMRAEGKAFDGEDIGDTGKDTDRIDSCVDNSVCNSSDSNNDNSNNNTLEKDVKNKESSKEGEEMKKLNGKNGVCNNKKLIKNHKHLTKEERYDLINKKFNEIKLQNNIKKEIHIDDRIPRENINDEYKKPLYNRKLKKNNVKLSVIDEKLSGT